MTGSRTGIPVQTGTVRSEIVQAGAGEAVLVHGVMGARKAYQYGFEWYEVEWYGVETLPERCI
jgi:hypothetical protein